MSNKVFYQHPNLMRALGMHETVMEVMVNVLGGGDSKVLYKYFFCFCTLAQFKDGSCFEMHICTVMYACSNVCNDKSRQ